MLENIIYKFHNRNSKKNLKAQLKELEKRFHELREETLGNNSMGWLTFSTYSINGNSHKQQADESLQGQINALREYLGVEYSDSKLVPKPKEEEKK